MELWAMLRRNLTIVIRSADEIGLRNTVRFLLQEGWELVHYAGVGDWPVDDDGGVVTIDRPEMKSRPKPKLKKPRMWHVVMLNDDYTPMDFVVLLLQRYFQKTADDAFKIMMLIHEKGEGIAGTYSFEVAETKQYAVMGLARRVQHPLLIELRPADEVQ